MDRVSVEEVERDPNSYMMRIMAGEEFEVTRNSEVFATMKPPSKKAKIAIDQPIRPQSPHK